MIDTEERYSKLSNNELLIMVYFENSDYTEEAIKIAKSILEERGIKNPSDEILQQAEISLRQAKISLEQEINQKRSENFFTGLFKWKMDEEELKNQIENYSTLGYFKSARKVATALMIFSVVITLIFMMVAWFHSENWIDIVLILILASFVYKGKKWAMIVTMIYWTFSKGLQLVSGFSVENFSGSKVISVVVWWAIFMGAFWQAYQVEKERKRLED